ncbi:MAG: hypothetical protein JST12_14530 [Armatimonadetes bacterium]|nr:hypothetical protein [Armatimonadota bacterium]
MSSLKINDAFSEYGLQSNIIISEVLSQFLKGESFVPLEKYRELGMSEDEITSVLTELRDGGLITFGSADPKEWGPIDSNEVAGINVTGLHLVVNFAMNKQPKLPGAKEADKAEFDEGRKDHRIGHAVYRALVRKGEIEDGKPVDYVIDIDRYTIHPDHVGEENPTVFSKVRHIVECQHCPTAEAAWEYWEQFVEDLIDGVSGCDGDVQETIDIEGAVHALVFDRDDDSIFTASVMRNDAGEDFDNWVLVSELKIESDEPESQGFDFWEQALDDLLPAESLAEPLQATLDDAQSSENEPESDANAEDGTPVGSDPLSFDLTIGSTKVSCVFAKGVKQDEIDATWFDSSGKSIDKVLKIKKERPTTKGQVKRIAETWLRELIN